jgi:hypothetical protein
MWWAWLMGLAKHAIFRTISVVCVLTVVAGIIFAVNKTFIHPKPTTSQQQKATTINNYNYNCKALIGWGCGKCK